MGVVVDQPFQILLELVQAHKLDPWDVDIERLTDVFLRRMRELRELDIRVSGRALLSASTLLRIKSDRALDGDGHGRVAEEELEEVLDIDLPELGPVLMIQRAPHMITLADLLSGLQEALREAPVGVRPARREMEKVVRTLSEYRVNIEGYLRRLHERIAKLAAGGRRVTMSELLEERTRLAVARTLLLLLFLCARRKITIWQEEPLGEVFISLLAPPGG